MRSTPARQGLATPGPHVNLDTHTLDLTIDLTPWGHWSIKGTRGQNKPPGGQVKATPGASKCHLLGVVLDLVFAVTQPASLPSPSLPDSPPPKKVIAATARPTPTRQGLAAPGPHVNLDIHTPGACKAWPSCQPIDLNVAQHDDGGDGDGDVGGDNVPRQAFTRRRSPASLPERREERPALSRVALPHCLCDKYT